MSSFELNPVYECVELLESEMHKTVNEFECQTIKKKKFAPKLYYIYDTDITEM